MAAKPPKFINPHAQVIHLPRPNGPGYVEVRPWNEKPHHPEGTYVVEGAEYEQYVPTSQLIPFRDEAPAAPAPAPHQDQPPAGDRTDADNQPPADDGADGDSGSGAGGSDSAGAGAPDVGGGDQVPPGGQPATPPSEPESSEEPPADAPKSSKGKPKPKR